jgi:2-methylcitrate dehydratase PrpD
VSRLAGLDAAQAANAAAIAACGAGGLRIAVGSDMKPHLAARTAEAGLRAASLAAAGVEAPPDAFEGFRGFIQVVNGGVWHERLNLGAFADPGLSLKLYPACSSIQAAAEALAAILAKHDILGGDVASVRCVVTAHIGANLTFPRPRTVTQAQFSMPFALGCILAHGRFTADLLSDAGLADPAVQDAMGRVAMETGRLFEAEAEAARYPEATRVVVTLREGTVLSLLQRDSTGKPNNPMGDAVLRGKFMTNAVSTLGQERAHRLADRILSVETLTDVRTLLAPPQSIDRAA